MRTSVNNIAEIKGTNTPRPDFLSVDEVARALRMNRNTVYRAVALGQIPSVRIGRKIRIPAAWLELEAGRERD